MCQHQPCEGSPSVPGIMATIRQGIAMISAMFPQDRHPFWKMQLTRSLHSPKSQLSVKIYHNCRKHRIQFQLIWQLSSVTQPMKASNLNKPLLTAAKSSMGDETLLTLLQTLLHQTFIPSLNVTRVSAKRLNLSARASHPG